jgi:hypothetical protein
MDTFETYHEAVEDTDRAAVLRAATPEATAPSKVTN